LGNNQAFPTPQPADDDSGPMKSTLSKTIDIEPVTDITLLVQTFNPLAHAFCLQLQRQGMAGRKLKIGVKGGE